MTFLPPQGGHPPGAWPASGITATSSGGAGLAGPLLVFCGAALMGVSGFMAWVTLSSDYIGESTLNGTESAARIWLMSSETAEGPGDGWLPIVLALVIAVTAGATLRSPPATRRAVKFIVLGFSVLALLLLVASYLHMQSVFDEMVALVAILRDPIDGSAFARDANLTIGIGFVIAVIGSGMAGIGSVFLDASPSS